MMLLRNWHSYKSKSYITRCIGKLNYVKPIRPKTSKNTHAFNFDFNKIGLRVYDFEFNFCWPCFIEKKLNSSPSAISVNVSNVFKDYFIPRCIKTTCFRQAI